MHCGLPLSQSFYIVAWALIFIGFVLIYLPALFRVFDKDGKKHNEHRKHREDRKEKKGFKFAFQNTIVLLLLAAVFGFFVLYHSHNEMALMAKAKMDGFKM